MSLKNFSCILVLLAGGCKHFIDPPPPPPPGAPTLRSVGSFDSPVYLTTPPGDTVRLFVVEQGGAVRVLHHDTTLTRPFLDLTGQISSGGERGLLSIAFDPLYATNGRFFVYFTDPAGDLRIVRYTVSSDPDSADEATADTTLSIPHPVDNNHNGGQLQFGPDGMLWVGTGDGGGSNDSHANGQNKHTLLGKLLRLDVSGASGYAIPTGNPWPGDTSFGQEVWAYGLRNPWRFSFDRQTGDLYIGDVGQNAYEEVDIAPASVQRGPKANYGWPVMEGKHCLFDPCTPIGTLPVAEYAHTPNSGVCAITGGYVYRGTALPDLAGVYFFADYCNGDMKGLRWPASTNVGDWTAILSPGNGISSFGEDARGELYILQLGGTVWRIVPSP